VSARGKWAREHCAGFDVPRIITEADGLRDDSWGNDTCPRFVAEGYTRAHADRGDEPVSLWCEYPNARLRETSGPRFCVTCGRGPEVCWTDSPAEALRVFYRVARAEGQLVRPLTLRVRP